MVGEWVQRHIGVAADEAVGDGVAVAAAAFDEGGGWSSVAEEGEAGDGEEHRSNFHLVMVPGEGRPCWCCGIG